MCSRIGRAFLATISTAFAGGTAGVMETSHANGEWQLDSTDNRETDLMIQSLHPTRRRFIRNAAATSAVLGLGDLSFLAGLRPVSAQEVQIDPNRVHFDSGIEPLVRLLEETPRARLLEVFAAKIKKGTSYQEVITALMLAGIRNIPPRPDVGWKFHGVLCINSAHMASLASAPQDRWLPIFYALDFFKSQQMYDERESEWSLGQVKEASVPTPQNSLATFNQAMDNWDDEAADASVAGLVRSAGAGQVLERFAYYGMRDFRNIGHKEIYMANAWRTLQYIGWRHAEPIMRSLAYALLNHHDDPNPSQNDLKADQPWRENNQLVDRIGANWQTGKINFDATSELVTTLRTGTWSEASHQVAELLNGDIAPQSICDALHAGACDLLTRQPGVYSLHAVTATNAMAYTYRTIGNDRTRRLLLLQNAAFLVQFRDYLKTEPPEDYRKSLANWEVAPVSELQPIKSDAQGDDTLTEIFETLSSNPGQAAGQTLAYLQGGPDRAESYVDSARKMVFLKTRNNHDYKFSSAILEDYHHISPAWRDHCLATSVYYLPGTLRPDNQLVQRTRAALTTT